MTSREKLPAVCIAENDPTRAFLAGEPRSLDTTLNGYRRFRSWSTRPFLTRPAILDARQTTQLDHDLPLLLHVLQSLPDRLFGGDEKEFAQAIGWDYPSVAYALEKLSGPRISFGRADLVNTPSGFRVVEYNTSSSLGFLEFGELCRAVLTDDVFSHFAECANLVYVDPFVMMIETLLKTTGFDTGGRPTIALVDWVNRPIGVSASLFIELLTDLGFRVATCTIDELEYSRNGLCAHDTPIEVVYRSFLLKDIAEDEEASEILRPLAEAVHDGAVRLFTPLNADLYGTKTCMALLGDDAHRSAFNAEEIQVLDRILPWTRSLLSNPAIKAGGPVMPLVDYVLGNREDLIIKPGIGHAGKGVFAGWLHSPEQWKRHVRLVAGSNHIVQRRAYSVAERFPGATPSDPVSACFLHWGMFVSGAGLSGGFVKGLPDKAQDVRFLGDGSHVGCVFHSTA